MLRKKDDVDFKEFEKFGFKYGTRDKFLYKTRRGGCEYIIYIDLLPCHNNNNEIKFDFHDRNIPEKIINTLYDLIIAGLIEKSR